MYNRLKNGPSYAPDDALKRIISNNRLSEEEKIMEIRRLRTEEEYQTPLSKSAKYYREDYEKRREEEKRCHFFCEDLCYRPFRLCTFGCGICMQILFVAILFVAFVWLIGYGIGWHNGGVPTVK